MLKGIDADVDFDFGVAAGLASACDQAASAVTGQAGTRAVAVLLGLSDFRGRFSELFRANAAVAAGDAVELGLRLGEVATGVRRLAEEARKEQQRREIARAWQAEQDSRGTLQKLKDAAGSGDDPPVGPPAAEPTIAVSAPVNRPRDTPAPGAGSRGGGTSSARPSSLRSFVSVSRGADAALATRPATLQGRYTDFLEACRWGTLQASGVFVGFARWLSANDQDATWATAVADAFRAAGGEGTVSTLSNSAVQAALKAAHVRVSRQDLEIDPPQAFGNPPTTGYADDPVNTATGNFVENETDLQFPGAAAGLALTRCYNSANSGSGAFGPGWSSLAGAGLTFDAGAGTARLTLADGRQVVFARLGDGWDRAVGENLWLAQDPDATDLMVSGNEGSWWRFTGAGVLTSYGTGPVEARAYVDLSRDEAGRLVRLDHARGQWIRLDWAGDRVRAATSADGRTVGYAYDAAGRLLSASGPAGTRSYEWNDQGFVTSVVDADGVVEVANRYDAQGRVTVQRSSFGRTTRYAYLRGRVTVVSDEDGARSNTWIADVRGRLVGVIDTSERRQSTSYDRWGNPVLSTERDGATTVHEYDHRGRRVRTVTPSGADLTWGYDVLDRVTTVVTEQGAVTRYGYAGANRNPSTVVDPEGGVTRLLWLDGLLTQVRDPTGVVVRFAYDRHGDPVGVTNADGATARLVRDALGRVNAAITPSGHRTTYTYDPVSGLLAQRRDPSGGTWCYEYTSAGRLAATVDPVGARTEVRYGAHGAETSTVDPLGRTVARRVDDLGNLAAVELADGSHWSFVHDALSRLTTTVDPTGGVWGREFDAAGHLVAQVDPTGVRVGVDLDEAGGRVEVGDGTASSASGFDPLGRLTSLAQPDGSAAVYTYDRCGRPVEALDADGGLTLVRRDRAGRVMAVVTPTGATTRYGYDGCGRLVSVTDPLGGVTAIGYDLDSRPVTQRLPTGETARTTYDQCGRVVEHHAPGVGTSRWVYDLAGRVVESVDPQAGRRTFRYDSAGQLVAAVAGNGGTTTYGYDGLGRATTITNPVGGVTRREFDGMNRCVAETDPLGRTTRAGYDAAGRLVWQKSPDGRRTTWTYDAAGRPASMAVDGRTVTALTRDLRRRTVRLTDRTDPDGRVVEHELEWNRGGRLIRRARGGQAVTWSYDADGRRTSMTTPDGTSTRYGWDDAGRLAWVDHSLLGRAAFDRDAAGRSTSAVAGGMVQSWEHRDGFVVGHTLTDERGTDRTAIDRDAHGRISRISRIRRSEAEVSTATDFAYDASGQLVEARNHTAGGFAVSRWRYDAAGRLVAESTDAATVQHVYDVAGQLISSASGDNRRRSYTYDRAGRRTQARDTCGGTREFVWNPTGYLAGVVHRDGDRVRRTTVHADALGELATVDGAEVFWDTASYAGAPVLAGDAPILAAGPVTGIGSDWTTPGWRTGRASGADPWTSDQTGTPGGVALSVGAAGGVSIDGLEWLGARVYDPTTRGFLSVDPLDPVTGAGWAGNPYAYAGNDPLHAVDPTGLSPVTDAQLQAYRDGNGLAGALRAAHTVNGAIKDWFSNNWEYVAGGAMVVAGGALIATGIGGPAGVMLISAGADTIIQKATSGDVNWGEVGVSFAAGAVGGGFAAAKLGATGVRAAVVSGAVSGAVGGGATGSYQYASKSGPHTTSGFLGATARGAGTGAAFGGVGGAAGHGLQTAGSRLLSQVRATPLEPVGVEGIRGTAGHGHAAHVLAGGRTDGDIVMAGHGVYRFGSGETTVPLGTTVHFYVEEGGGIADEVGQSLEIGEPRRPVRSYAPGDVISDYTLKTPDDLTIYSGSHTVDRSTPLSELLKSNMGTVHWAACLLYE